MKKPPVPQMLNGAPAPPPPPPPRTRKGSTFPLQTFGTRLSKLPNVGNTVNQPVVTGKKTISVIGTMDGGVGCLLPLDEKMYKRLYILQQVMTTLLPVSFHLNPKEFRLARQYRIRYPSNFSSSLTSGTAATTNNSTLTSIFENRKPILDGCVLFRYLTLDSYLQDELAQIIGVQAHVLRENLHEIDYLMRFF